MEKKKLKLSISGTSKKTIDSIEQARTQSKNTVVIEKRSSKFSSKTQFSRPIFHNNKAKTVGSFVPKKNLYSKPTSSTNNTDFEKRKLAEQRATRRLKGELPIKEGKSNKSSIKKRELKLTVSRALSDQDMDIRSRSMASLKRAKQKENRILNKEEVR